VQKPSHVDTIERLAAFAKPDTVLLESHLILDLAALRDFYNMAILFRRLLFRVVYSTYAFAIFWIL